MAISIYSNRFAAGLRYHNMSAPPRTSVTLSGEPVAGRTAVYSFTFALAHWDRAERLLPGAVWKWRACHTKFSTGLRKCFADPEKLFRAIGEPILPTWDTDFLIGFRLSVEEMIVPEKIGARLCSDPLLCAGIITRCAGNIYLSRRKPTLIWEALLSLPIAFDDPIASLP
jgi:hypothetical protein